MGSGEMVQGLIALAVDSQGPGSSPSTKIVAFLAPGIHVVDTQRHTGKILIWTHKIIISKIKKFKTFNLEMREKEER